MSDALKEKAEKIRNAKIEATLQKKQADNKEIKLPLSDQVKEGEMRSRPRVRLVGIMETRL